MRDATIVCNHIATSIYEEDETQLVEGLPLSFETFIASIDKDNTSLNSAKALAATISKLDVGKEGVLKDAYGILEKHLSACTGDKGNH